MRGTIVKYDTGRKFGFIRPIGSHADDIFFHADALNSQKQVDLPTQGMLVSFDTTQGEKGLRAVNVTIQKRPVSPHKFFMAATVFLTVGIMLAILVGMKQFNLTLAPIYQYLLAVNAAAFIICGFDKSIARGASLRVPEKVLFGVATIGGSLGLIAGMKFFRHKTKTSRFQFILALIVLIQFLIWKKILPIYIDTF